MVRALCFHWWGWGFDPWLGNCSPTSHMAQPKERRGIYRLMFIALFTVTMRWKQPKCPLTDEWINQMWCIHTVRYYSTSKRKENLTHATVWMNQSIMLSEIKSHSKMNTVWFHLNEVPLVVRLRDGKWYGGFQGLEGERKEDLLNGYRVSLQQNEEFCGWMVVMVAQQCEGT